MTLPYEPDDAEGDAEWWRNAPREQIVVDTATYDWLVTFLEGEKFQTIVPDEDDPTSA